MGDARRPDVVDTVTSSDLGGFNTETYIETKEGAGYRGDVGRSRLSEQSGERFSDTVEQLGDSTNGRTIQESWGRVVETIRDRPLSGDNRGIEEEAYSMRVGSWSFMKIEYLLKNHPKKILKMLEEEETAKEYLTKLENQAEQMYQTHLAQLKSGLSLDEQEKYQTMNELMAKEKVVYSLICTQTTN